MIAARAAGKKHGNIPGSKSELPASLRRWSVHDLHPAWCQNFARTSQACDNFKNITDMVTLVIFLLSLRGTDLSLSLSLSLSLFVSHTHTHTHSHSLSLLRKRALEACGEEVDPATK